MTGPKRVPVRIGRSGASDKRNEDGNAVWYETIPLRLVSRDQRVEHIAMDVGQAEISAGVAIG